MRGLATLALVAGLVVAPLSAQRGDDVADQRAAVEAWATCIADEKRDDAARLLALDFRSDAYKIGMKQLGKARVSRECFEAMPRAYRKIELGGLPFAGGLAERLIEQDSEPLLTRLSMAAIGEGTQTYSYTDGIAMCMVRGAPHLVAILFDTSINSGEEVEALAQLQPVADACTREGRKIEASPLAMRSMLATASYRLLTAQESGDDA